MTAIPLPDVAPPALKFVEQTYEVRPIHDAKPYPTNVRRGDLEAIEESMIENGIYGAILVQRSTGFIAVGNHRWRVMERRGVTHVPMFLADLTDAQTRRIALADNRTNDLAGYDQPGLARELEAVIAESGGLKGTAWSDADFDALKAALKAAEDDAGTRDDDEGTGGRGGPTLADRFIVPPFSVLDARQGYWQDRKRQWIALGIRSELGRDRGLMFEPEAPASVVEREADIPEGSPLWEEIRAYLRERLKASGKTQKAVNDEMGVVGMATHWFGKSQPELPSPEQWAKLKPILGLDDRYDGPMLSTIERPAAESTQVMADRQRRAGAFTQPAPVGGGGLSDQLAPRRWRGSPNSLADRVERANDGGTQSDGRIAGVVKRAPRPGGRGADAPAQPFGRRYSGGDAWRGSGKPESFNSNDRLRALQRTGDSTQTEDVGGTGTSIFDPVLCEIAYRWFSVDGAAVLDPFAGGSVRGVVAAKLGRAYTGIELRREQVEANREQAATILRGAAAPTWIEGDSRAELPRLEAESFDLVFSCPPYADLEVYSDDPRDISNMPHADFLAAHREIIGAACRCLRPNRFAVWVIGDVRDSRGVYLDLVSQTIDAFRAGGLSYYNDAVLVTAVGSLPVRAGRIFQRSRKLGKGHQNVLVFYKGNPADISQHFPMDIAVEAFAPVDDAPEPGEPEPSSDDPALPV